MPGQRNQGKITPTKSEKLEDQQGLNQWMLLIILDTVIIADKIVNTAYDQISMITDHQRL